MPETIWRVFFPLNCYLNQVKPDSKLFIETISVKFIVTKKYSMKIQGNYHFHILDSVEHNRLSSVAAIQVH